MAARSIAFASALEELASLFHRIAVAQAVPAAAASMDDAERIAGFAAGMSPESVQLAYQICVQGRADLAARTGRGDGILDDAAAPACLRAGRHAEATAGVGVAPPCQRAPARTKPAAPGRRSHAAHAVRRDAAPSQVSDPAPTQRAPPRRSTAARLALPTDAAPMAGIRRRTQALAPSPASSPRRPSSSVAGQRADARRAGGAQASRRQGLRRQAQGRARPGDRPQAACSRSRLASAADASLAAQESRERAEQKARTEAAFRDEPFVRDVLARFDATITAGFDQARLLDSDARPAVAARR